MVMKRIRAASLSDLSLLTKAQEAREECEYKCNSISSPNLFAKISRLQRRVNIKLVKRWKREFYSKMSPVELEEYKKKKRPSEFEKGIKYGQYLMIGLALFSIPMDCWKLYEGIQKSERAIDGPTPYEVLDYYSATLTTHFVGLAAAVEKDLIITLLCRLVSTFVYQAGITRSNSSIPTDPKELHKYIRDHVPKHRLPKGYKPIDPETIQSTVPNSPKRPSSRSGKSKKSTRTGSKKQSTSKATANAKGKKGTANKKSAKSSTSKSKGKSVPPK